MTVEMPNLRTAFRWAADHNDLDSAATIATMRHSSVSGANSTKPSGGPRNSSNPRALSNTGAWRSSTLWRRCASRPEGSRPPSVMPRPARKPSPADASTKSARTPKLDRQPILSHRTAWRWVEWCRAVIARRPVTNVHAQALLAIALKMAGADDEATAASEELLAAADTTDNPNLAAWALFAYGMAHRDVAPAAA